MTAPPDSGLPDQSPASAADAVLAVMIAVLLVLLFASSGGNVQSREDKAEDTPRLQWDKPIQRDGISIKIIALARGMIKFEDIGFSGKQISEMEGVAVTIEVANTDKNRKNDGFYFSIAAANEEDALKDNFGNKYKLLRTAFGPRPVGEKINSGGLYPDKRNVEVLAFQPPVATAKILILQLHGRCYEGKGKNQYVEIPISEFKEAK